jgi:hypothetical protein
LWESRGTFTLGSLFFTGQAGAKAAGYVGTASERLGPIPIGWGYCGTGGQAGILILFKNVIFSRNTNRLSKIYNKALQLALFS